MQMAELERTLSEREAELGSLKEGEKELQDTLEQSRGTATQVCLPCFCPCDLLAIHCFFVHLPSMHISYMCGPAVHGVKYLRLGMNCQIPAFVFVADDRAAGRS